MGACVPSCVRILATVRSTELHQGTTARAKGSIVRCYDGILGSWVHARAKKSRKHSCNSRILHVHCI